MSMKTTQTRGWLSLAALFAAGCDAYTGGDYQGEALATLRGEVRLERESPPPNKEIEIFYQNYTDYVLDDDDISTPLLQFAVPDSMTVTGEYPAAFTLDLFEPPPDEALTDFTVNGDPDERRVGLGIVASSYECDTYFEEYGGRCIFGGAARTAVVYTEDDILPGTRAARFVGTPLTAGYHLLEYRPNFANAEEYNECFEDCERWTLVGEIPLDTLLTVRLIDGFDRVFGNKGGSWSDFGGLELPDWFDPVIFPDQ